MANHEEQYSRKIQEIENGLQRPEIKKKIDKLINELNELFGCDFTLMYDFFPEAEEYGNLIDQNKINVPKRDVDTMTLGELISHISKEDKNYRVFIDPIYLKKGVNEINDVLTTTINNDVIVVPISHNKE